MLPFSPCFPVPRLCSAGSQAPCLTAPAVLVAPTGTCLPFRVAAMPGWYASRCRSLSRALFCALVQGCSATGSHEVRVYRKEGRATTPRAQLLKSYTCMCAPPWLATQHAPPPPEVTVAKHRGAPRDRRINRRCITQMRAHRPALSIAERCKHHVISVHGDLPAICPPRGCSLGVPCSDGRSRRSYVAVATSLKHMHSV